jgi:hypothetical protein
MIKEKKEDEKAETKAKEKIRKQILWE